MSGKISLPIESRADIHTDIRTDIREQYGHYLHHKAVFLVFLLLLLIIFSLVAIGIGSLRVSPWEVLLSLLKRTSDLNAQVVVQVRLPRVLLGISAGAALGVSGCVMQAVLHNPMASASTLGISQGAAFGASFAIVVLGAGNMKSYGADTLSITNPYLVSICAFAVAMITTLIIMYFSKRRQATAESMILAGVAIASILTGGTTLLQYFADDIQLAAVVYWTFGDLGRGSWMELKIISTVAIAIFVYFYYNRWAYNALDSGESTAKTLGIRVASVRTIGLAFCALLTATVVSFVGIISFVGLVGPHLVRRFIGTDHRYLLPASALAGACLLVISDTIARTVLTPIILPVGAITSFIGGPMFLYLLFRGGKKYGS